MDSFVLLAICLTIPISAITTYIISKKYKKYTILELSTFLVGISVTLSFLFFCAEALVKYHNTTDTEIISGYVSNKTRDQGHYRKPYDCQCRKNSNGDRVCKTCYEDRYTVEWQVFTTVGNHTIQKLDRSSRSVYLSPDPERYKVTILGEPAANNNSYTNYMLGVPNEYLYNDNLGAPKELLDKIPKYPLVYDYYRANRLVVLDNAIDANLAMSFNTNIAEKLKTMGKEKEVNIILVVGPPDQNTMYAVREKWNGGKKNDVIVILGVENGTDIKEANILTWSKNYYFKEKLQQELIDHKVLDIDALDKIYGTINVHYTRPEMKDYEHLQDYAQTPNWLIFLMYIILFAVPTVIFFKRK